MGAQIPLEIEAAENLLRRLARFDSLGQCFQLTDDRHHLSRRERFGSWSVVDLAGVALEYVSEKLFGSTGRLANASAGKAKVERFKELFAVHGSTVFLMGW